MDAGLAGVRRDGRFELVVPADGEYDLMTYVDIRGSTPPRRLRAAKRVNLHGLASITVDLDLQPPAVVRGRFEFRGTAAPPDPSGMQAVLRPADPERQHDGAAAAQVAKSGEFTCSVSPGRYRIGQSWGASYQGWWVHSATLKGRDVTDELLEIGPGDDIGDVVLTFTDRPTEIVGSVTIPPGRATGSYTVTVFPVAREKRTPASRWIASARVDLDGRFVVMGLPPGEYFIAPAVDLEFDQEFDREFLQRLEGTQPMRITLREGEQRRIELRAPGLEGTPRDASDPSDSSDSFYFPPIILNNFVTGS
jgi:hypothetical protein